MRDRSRRPRERLRARAQGTGGAGGGEALFVRINADAAAPLRHLLPLVTALEGAGVGGAEQNGALEVGDVVVIRGNERLRPGQAVSY